MMMTTEKVSEFLRLRVWAWALALLVLAAACGDRNVYAPPPPPKVSVSQPVRQQVTDFLEFTGNTQALNTVKLRARVEGFLEQVLFQDGDRVKKGQVLFIIQQNTYQAKLQQAEAELLAQKARLEHAQTEFARFSTLLKQKAAAQTDVDRWRFERDASRAAVMAAEASRELARLNLSYTTVTAPFDGRIDRRLKDVGNLVGAGEETVLAEINQIDPIYVYFTINERDLLQVLEESKKVSDRLERPTWPIYMGLSGQQGFPFSGHFDFAAISVNPTTGTLLLRGVFANPEYRILPGLFARVRAPSQAGPRPALLINQEAINFDQQGPYVLVVNDQKIVERRSVTLGQVVNNLQVVQEGLTGSEWVIVSGALRAIPGRPVTPEPVPSQTAAHSQAE